VGALPAPDQGSIVRTIAQVGVVPCGNWYTSTVPLFGGELELNALFIESA